MSLQPYSALQKGLPGGPDSNCIADPYYNIPDGDPLFANVSLLLHCDGTNGSTTYVDSSSNNFSVTATVPLTTTNPKFGTAAALNSGGADAIVVAHNAAFSLGNGDFTLEGWFARTALTSGERTILSKGANKTPANFSYAVYTDTENFVFQYSDGTTSALLFHSTFMTNGVYFHWAVCRAGNTIRLFINGVQRASAAFSGTINNNTAALRFFEPAYASVSSPGRLDDFRLTKGAARYFENFTPPTQAFPDALPTVAGFTLLSLHGETLLDTSAQTKTVTNSGVTVSTAQSRFGGSSLYFSPGSVKSLAITPAGPFQLLPGTPFTVEFYIYLNAAPGGPEVSDVIALGGPGAGAGNVPVRGGWAVAITPSRQLQLRVGDFGASTFNSLLTTTLVPLGTWISVAVSFFGTAVTPAVFFDGVAQATTTSGAVSWAIVTPNEPDSTQLFIGRYDQRGGTAPRVLDAYIDDLRVTTGVARYTGNFIPPTLTFCDSSNGFPAPIPPVPPPPLPAPTPLPVVKQYFLDPIPQFTPPGRPLAFPKQIVGRLRPFDGNPPIGNALLAATVEVSATPPGISGFAVSSNTGDYPTEVVILATGAPSTPGRYVFTMNVVLAGTIVATNYGAIQVYADPALYVTQLVEELVLSRNRAVDITIANLASDIPVDVAIEGQPAWFPEAGLTLGLTWVTGTPGAGLIRVFGTPTISLVYPLTMTVIVKRNTVEVRRIILPIRIV